jgi:hypothetical protein
MVTVVLTRKENAKKRTVAKNLTVGSRENTKEGKPLNGFMGKAEYN